MNQEEYLEKLVSDFGDSNSYAEDEKKEFLEMLKLLLEINEDESNLENIINLIIKIQ
jgi:hypothetical protein